MIFNQHRCPLLESMRIENQFVETLRTFDWEKYFSKIRVGEHTFDAWLMDSEVVVEHALEGSIVEYFESFIIRIDASFLRRILAHEFPEVRVHRPDFGGLVRHMWAFQFRNEPFLFSYSVVIDGRVRFAASNRLPSKSMLMRCEQGVIEL
jgi:hypothetical protein